jgi:hypothetical protein
MRAFFTPEELRWGLVSTSSLNEPPEGGIVTAFWAFDLRRRHGFYFVFFVAENFHRRQWVLLDYLWL